MKQDIKILFKSIYKDDILALASQLAYGFILSFFPFLIFLLTIVGYSSIKSADVLVSLKMVLPQNAFELIKSTVIDIVDSRQGDLLSFSLLGTIWSASVGFRAVIKGLNRAYNEDETRNYFQVIGISILCIFALTLIIIGAFLLLIFGDMIGHKLFTWFNLNNDFPYFWNVARYVIMIIFMIFTFAALYHLTPSKRLKWREVLPGATFTTLGWLIASMLFSYYVNNFNNYSNLYGSIGTAIVLILWLYITSVIILVGGELNAVLSREETMDL